MDTKRFLNLTELSRVLNCAPQTIAKRVDAGLLVPDGLSPRGYPYFEASRVEEIRALLGLEVVLTLHTLPMDNGPTIAA